LWVSKTSGNESTSYGHIADTWQGWIVKGKLRPKSASHHSGLSGWLLPDDGQSLT
jgi:hypothetical protein